MAVQAIASGTAAQTAAATTESKPKAKANNETPETAGGRLGGDVDKLEKQLIAAYGKAEPSEKEIKKLELQYKRASLALEGFMQLMKNRHELLMRGIQALALR